jgi:arsenite-transporting ATPase
MMRLQDPDYTKVIIVTLAETTPVLEAEALVADLRRAGIHPWAWVVNNALSSTGTTNPLLLARAALEAPLLARVAAQAPALAVVPTQLAEPTGRAELLNLSAPLALSAP